MSVMATARIPDELYAQGKELLESMGSNTTELIRSAFDYVIKSGKLPQVEKPVQAHSRELSAEQREELAKSLRATRVRVSLPADFDYKKELHEGKWADYEALA